METQTTTAEAEGPTEDQMNLATAIAGEVGPVLRKVFTQVAQAHLFASRDQTAAATGLQVAFVTEAACACARLAFSVLMPRDLDQIDDAKKEVVMASIRDVTTGLDQILNDALAESIGHLELGFDKIVVAARLLAAETQGAA